MLPLFAACLITWLGAVVIGRGRVPDFWPALGLAVALVAVTWVLHGPLHFPPDGALEKLSYLAGVALALGLLIEAVSAGRGMQVVAMGWVWLVVGWLAWPVVSAPDWIAIAAAIAIALAGSLAVGRLRESGGGASFMMLLVAAFALSAIAHYSNAHGMAKLIAALGAGTVGAAFGLLLARGGGLVLGGSLLLVGGGSLVGLATILLLYTSVSPWPVIFLLPIFFADLFADRSVSGNDGLGKSVAGSLRVLVFLIGLLAPAVGAVLLTQQLGG